MKNDEIHIMTNTFEGLSQETENGIEYWLARDIQHLLCYAKWENFLNVISKAKTACEVSGHQVSDHFPDVRAMVELGSGSQRDINDMMLTRYDLTGGIEGIGAMEEMGGTEFLIGQDRFWQGFKQARDEYLSYGVTMAQNAWMSRSFLKYFASLPKDEDPGIDVVLLPIGEEEPAMTTGDTAVDWPGNAHFKLRPRKLFTDGAFQLQTAYLSEPYFKVVNKDTPCGMPYVDPQDHRDEVKRLHRLGYQIHCHCNGDAGAEMFINAVAEALAEHPLDDHRHTVIHGQVLREDQLTRMAKLGMTVSFFPAHIHFWGDMHYNTMLGPDRAERISPTASAERLGIRYTIHNDASVTPTRPLHLAHCAVNRQTHSGRVLGEDQKISVISALRAMTIDAAWQVFEEKERGSLESGKIADFAVISDNPLNDGTHINNLVVTKTIRRGLTVFEKMN